MNAEERIVLALDGLTHDRCEEIVRAVGSRVYACKVHDMWDEYGARASGLLTSWGATRVFADLKLHDIPKTVARRVKRLADAGVAMTTVHASGEADMVSAAKDAAPHVEVFAVTVLTSLSVDQCTNIYGASPFYASFRLAMVAADGSADGIVCSGKEIESLRKNLNDFGTDADGLKYLVPGVRIGKDMHDQARVVTPASAIRLGATYVVVGREVTQAQDPVAALDAIVRNIRGEDDA